MQLSNDYNDFDFARGLVQVPNDFIARLMYYLNCISYLIDMDRNVDTQYYTDYSSYSNMTSREDRLKIWSLCRTAHPDILLNNCIFNASQIESDTSSNRFYEVNEFSFAFAHSANIIIQGASHIVNRLMVFDNEWLSRNFIIPFNQLENELFE